MKKLRKVVAIIATTMLLATAFVGCSEKTKDASTDNSGNSKTEKKIKIGFSMDTLKEERWQKDRDIFKARVEAAGAECLVQAAQGDDATQVSQAENLISQGVDVLVVVPHNADACATIVEKAHAAKIPVIAYDRLIKNSDLDLYVSFDNFKVGQLQAEYISKLAPSGTYVYIGGAPTDNNAKLFRDGAMDVLKKNANIKIAFDQMSDEWKPENAQKNMENALTKLNNKVDAVVCANDGTAGGAIAALADQKLDGKIPVSGQDAELAACMRIVEGKQAMTIYKPIKLLAEKVADIAVGMAKGEKPQTNGDTDNGKIKVPSILLEPIQVDKKNMADTVIKDKFHTVEEVYKNVPKDQWPK